MKIKHKSRLILCILTGWLLSYAITVEADTNAEKITPTPVTQQIYVIAGKDGNVGIFTGDDGTFLIDDNFAPLTGKILEAIKSIGGDHPRFLINTHYHGDHTGGNENLGKADTLIFSHDNVRERLKNGSFIEAFDMKSEAMAPERHARDLSTLVPYS